MKNGALILLFLAGCGQTILESGHTDLAVVQNKVDSVSGPLDSESCKCAYYPPESVELIFSKRTLINDLYEVEFIVKESNGNQFSHNAHLGKSCSDDFQKRRIISGMLKRKETGTCSPMIIQPKDYDFPCWRL